MIAAVRKTGRATRAGLAALGLAALGLATLAGACGGPGREALTSSTTRAPATSTATATAATTVAANTTTVTATTVTATTVAANTTRAAPTATTTTTAAVTTAPPSTTPPTAARTTTTVKRAPWTPPSPAPTISQAAYELVGAWAARSRKAALADASPGAVAALFSNPYPARGPQYRGCSTPPAGTPASCVYRSGNDLLSLTVSPFPNGWGVTAAAMES